MPEETFRGRGARPTPLRGALPVRVPVASVLDKGDRGGGSPATPTRASVGARSGSEV